MKVILISLVTALLTVGCVVLPENHHRHDSGYDHDRYDRGGRWDRDHDRWNHADGSWRYADRH